MKVDLLKSVFQIEFTVRFDRPMFEFESAWNERSMRHVRYAVWWPRFYLSICGISFGIALFIPKKKEEQ